MLKYNEPLSLHTSFRIGGNAFCWIEPKNPEKILEAIHLAESRHLSFAVFGRGTNLLVKDEGFDGIVIHIGKGFDEIKRDTGQILKAGAGVSLSKLIKYACENGLAGCEFLTGIPGDFGGAVFMNAGMRSLKDSARFDEIKDIILDVEVLDLKDKKIKTLDRKEIDFKYRSSGLGGKVILGARIGLEKDKKSSIIKRISAFNKKRDWIKKIKFPSAGSVFKNPENEKPAGALIESCGLKGKRIGGAEISNVHANVIVNLGGATSKDVLSLIELVKNTVKKKFGVNLELELRVI